MSYSGRATDEPSAYLYQQIVGIAPGATLPSLPSGAKGIAIIGYAVDEGVRLNLGRTGAADGPAALRDRLGKEVNQLPESLSLIDLGDVQHRSEKLYDTLLALSHEVTRARKAGYITVVLGGGHDLAAGHYLGLHRADAPTKAQTLGVVNFDAHLDMRPLALSGPTSGTPLTLIKALNVETKQPFKYACVGVQRAANTRQLIASATQQGADLIYLDELESASERLLCFSESVDKIYITVDLDGFPGYVSPGVSAPGVDGLAYRQVRELISQLVATHKVIGFDVAECNPNYDLDARTARLGARLISDYLLAASI